MRRFSFPRFLSCFLLLLSTENCQESLPGRQDPTVPLVGKASKFSQTTYADTTVSVYLTIKNAYTDYLDDIANIDGSIDVVLLRDPTIRKHGVLGNANLFFARSYNPTTHKLTIAPGDSILLRYVWNMADDAGDNLADPGDHNSPILMFSHDPNCGTRVMTMGEQFEVSGQVTIFSHVGLVVVPSRTFSLCFFRYPGFPPGLVDGACPPPQLSSACINQ